MQEGHVGDLLRELVVYSHEREPIIAVLIFEQFDGLDQGSLPRTIGKMNGLWKPLSEAAITDNLLWCVYGDRGAVAVGEAT